MKIRIKPYITAGAGALALWLMASYPALPGNVHAAILSPAPALSVAAPDSAPERTPENVAAAPSESPDGTVAAGRNLTEIVVTDQGIDLIIDGPLANYTAFPMKNPDRFVIDLPDVRADVTANKVPRNAFGLESVRLVELEGKCRIVFARSTDGFNKAKVIRTERGLQLQLPAPAPLISKSAENSPTLPAPPAHDTHYAMVQSLDFEVVDTGSRITMKVSDSCVAAQPVKNDKGVTFFVKQCTLPRNLRRVIDTSAFPSAVQSVTPSQLSVKGVPETRIFVKLNQAATWSVSRDKGTIILDITHPKPAQKADKGAAVSSPQPLPRPDSQPQPTSPELTIKKLQESATAPPGTKKVYTGRKVTLEFSDADVRKIFQLIAEVSNLNILLGDDVSGTITIKLVNVPWDQALDTILDAKGLGMRADGNIVLIKPKGKFKSSDEEALDAKKSREKMMELQTRVFDVNFAQASDVVSQFKSLGSGRTDSSISQDDRTNKVIVTDIEPAITRMKKFLESIDIPEKQVLIEARIVEVSTNYSQDLGVNWGIHYRDASASIMGVQSIDSGFGGAVSAPVTSGTYGPGMASGITFGTVASNINVDMRLSALAIADKAKIISTPRVVTLNNKAAKMTQGQMIPYSNTTSTTGAVTQFVEAALSLEVTPHITPDGSVMMKIKASNNSAGSGGTPPPINKKEATTELLVKHGETTVIGGIYTDSNTVADTGIPFLMDIPLLGWLFKSNSMKNNKTELLIFITPRILS